MGAELERRPTVAHTLHDDQGAPDDAVQGGGVFEWYSAGRSNVPPTFADGPNVWHEAIIIWSGDANKLARV